MIKTSGAFIAVVVTPIPGASRKGTTDKKCPADGAALDLYALSRIKFEGCPTCHGMWLDKDELRKLKNKFNDGQLHWLNREVNDIEKTSMISSSRVCPKCPSSKLRSVMFGQSGVVIDWSPIARGSGLIEANMILSVNIYAAKQPVRLQMRSRRNSHTT